MNKGVYERIFETYIMQKSTGRNRFGNGGIMTEIEEAIEREASRYQGTEILCKLREKEMYMEFMPFNSCLGRNGINKQINN